MIDCRRFCNQGPVIFKFIHAADIHLDSPLRGLERYEGAPVDQIREAARGALVNLVDLAIEQQVDFVLIAGDLYDGNWKDYQTGLFFVSQAARLRVANIPLLMISGNHDAENKMTRSLQLPDNVTLFSTKSPETVTIDGLDVAIHGQGFATAAVFEDLSESYPDAKNGCFNIGMLHTCGTGGGATAGGHERYAPCTIDGLRLKGYDYWALGHIHKREVLSEKPFIAFPGNVQGRHVRETGAKGCLLVTVDDQREIDADFRPLDTMRWEIVQVDVEGINAMNELLDRVRVGLQKVFQAAEGRALAVRVELAGATELHRQLLAEKVSWINEIRAIGIDAGQGELWIEKVKFQTSDSSADPVATTVGEDAIGELTNLFDRIKSEPDQVEGLGFDLTDVVRKLPADLKTLVQKNDEEWWRSVVAESEALLLENLLEKPGK